MAMMQKARDAAPQNPGQVDVTSPEAAANPNVMGTPPTAAGAVTAAREDARAPETPEASGEGSQATPEEQAEYERAMSAVQEVLYDNEGTSTAIADMLQPEDKINSTVQAAVLAIQQIDQRIDLDETVIPEVARDTTALIMDVGESAKGMSFSDQEADITLGAVWEALLTVYGVDEDAYDQLTSGLSEEQIAGYENQIKQTLEV